MKIKKYVLLYLFSKAICATEIGYDTIYLLKFDNLKNDFPYSHMEEALPDLIRENYEFRQDLTIKYIENINPNIEKKSNNLICNFSCYGLHIVWCFFFILQLFS